MFGALKFIPRDEMEKESSRERSKKRKHKHKDRGKDKNKNRGKKKRSFESNDSSSDSSSDDEKKSDRNIEGPVQEIREDARSKRTEAGMEWMLKAPERLFDRPAPPEVKEEITLDSETPASSSRELNPYLNSGTEEGGERVLARPAGPLVGDGGASWRMKALKRAQEQAAREGRKLDEVVEERWGSLASLTSSVAVKRSAHANAHLHAIRNRKTRTTDELGDDVEKALVERTFQRPEHGSRMKVPKTDSSFFNKRKTENRTLRPEDAAIIRAAATTMNKYDNDGSFLKNFKSAEPARVKEHSPAQEIPRPRSKLGGDDHNLWGNSSMLDEVVSDPSSSESEEVPHRKLTEPSARDGSRKSGQAISSSAGLGENQAAASTRDGSGKSIPTTSSSEGLSANQAAAKAMKLRLMGKSKEADELMNNFKEAPKAKEVPRLPSKDASSVSAQTERHGIRAGGMNLNSVLPGDNIRARNQSCDAELAGSIAGNKLYKGPLNVDDEYEYGDGLETGGSRGKKGNKKPHGAQSLRPRGEGSIRMPTRHERCQLCFENADRPKHLVVAIANSTYLMIPPRTSLVPFHCYIVPMQHDGASRNVDESVWQEFRNFKKCLVQMFADHGKEVLFLETAMAVNRQRKHCFIECIPVPSDAAKDAPLYFKKAIDEAEDEWSQHNAKKLLDTCVKGLRNSIPKNFPYFHVEFGMKGGYAHVIDDESSFKTDFGLDVVAGILELPEEDTYGQRRQESREQQKKRVADFLKLWEPFDWTKMLD